MNFVNCDRSQRKRGSAFHRPNFASTQGWARPPTTTSMQPADIAARLGLDHSRHNRFQNNTLRACAPHGWILSLSSAQNVAALPWGARFPSLVPQRFTPMHSTVKTAHANGEDAIRALLQRRLEELHEQERALRAQRESLTALLDSAEFQLLLSSLRAAVTAAQPSIEEALADAFRAAHRSLRLSDVVNVLVRERGIPATPDQIADVLRASPRFQASPQGWWTYREPGVTGARSRRHLVAGGST
jgi:hypothetical protein